LPEKETTMRNCGHAFLAQGTWGVCDTVFPDDEPVDDADDQ
jgi:hypothetical protein